MCARRGLTRFLNFLLGMIVSMLHYMFGLRKIERVETCERKRKGVVAWVWR